MPFYRQNVNQKLPLKIFPVAGNRFFKRLNGYGIKNCFAAINIFEIKTESVAWRQINSGKDRSVGIIKRDFKIAFKKAVKDFAETAKADNA